MRSVFRMVRGHVSRNVLSRAKSRWKWRTLFLPPPGYFYRPPAGTGARGLGATETQGLRGGLDPLGLVGVQLILEVSAVEGIITKNSN